MQNIHGKEIDLLRTTVKVPGKRLPRATPATAPGASPRANGLALERSSAQLGGGTGEGAAEVGGGVWLPWPRLSGRVGRAATGPGRAACGAAPLPSQVLRAPHTPATRCLALGSAQPAQLPQRCPRAVSRGGGRWTAWQVRMGTDSLVLTGGISVEPRQVMVGTPGPSGTRATSQSSLLDGQGGRREGTELPGANLVTVLRSAVRGGGGGGLFAQRRLSLERSWRPSGLCAVSREVEPPECAPCWR